MKRLNTSVQLLLIGLLLTLGGCSKSFLNTTPKEDFDENSIVNAQNGTEAFLEGIHGMFYQYSFGQFHGNGYHSLNTRVDWLSDLYVNSLPAIYMPLYRWEDHTSPYGGMNFNVWDFWYTVIQHTNKILTLSDKAKYDTEARYNTVMAEAYILRAYGMSILVQLFSERYVPGAANDGLGIIIRTTPTLEPKPRATVAETYQQIIADVDKAMELYAKVKEAKALIWQNNRINYAVANGMAARIYLGKLDYEKALSYADAAIKEAEANGYALQSGAALLDGFNNADASEWMWGYRHTDDQNPYFAGWGAHYSYNFAKLDKKPTLAINRSYYDKMGEKDVRRQWFIARQKKSDGTLETAKELRARIPSDANMAGYFQFRRNGTMNFEYTGVQIKFRTRYGAGNSTMDAPMMRLAEVYFIKSEAEARLGKNAEALATLEKVMKTRDEAYTANASLSGEELANEILRNKWIDLYFEGGVFLDQKRLAHVPQRLTASNPEYMEPSEKTNYPKRNSGNNAKFIPTTADDRAWQFAIPYDEIKGNTLCKQNPLK